MSTHDVEVRPYGTKNEVGSVERGTATTSVEIKPPYGSRQEVEVRPAQQSSSSGGQRTDVEVRPYGNTETLLKPQQQQQYTSYQQSTTQRPAFDVNSLKNPLLATAMGITLALMLLSLSHVPKMVSHWWQGDRDRSLMKQYDSYDTYSRGYPGQHGHYEESHWRGPTDLYYAGKNKASQMFNNVKETVEYPFEAAYHRARDAVVPRSWRSEDRNERYYRDERDYSRSRDREYGPRGESMYERAKDYIPGARTGESMYERAKDYIPGARGESMYERAKDYIPGARGESMYERAKDYAAGSGGSYSGGNSLTEEARRAACRTAEKARDMACDYNSNSWGGGGRDTMDYARERGRDALDSARYQYENARYQARDASWKAQDMYENAKNRAADLVESAKDTVTYPVRAAQDAMSRSGEAARDTASNTYERAKDTVVNTEERARGVAGSTFQAAKDTLYNAKEAVKDTVLGAKDSVLGAGETVKDTVVGAGQAVREKLTTSNAEDYEYHGQARGPTKVRVEVQEM